jgi:major vault protein
LRIKPNHYIHVLDNNTNVTRVEVGPRTFTRQEHEEVVFGPEVMIMVPPRHYCIVQNPVVRNEQGALVRGEGGQVKLKHGDEEIRFAQDPFPLYPGEKLSGRPSPLQVVGADQALRLRCIRDHDGHVAGDEWLFKGPATYLPRVEVQVVEVIRAIVIKQNQALKLRARYECVDADGNKRLAGEEWLVGNDGAYLPNVDEEVVGTIAAHVLTPTTALHLRATNTFTDCFKKQRRAGDEWLVTLKDCETHIPDVYEQVVGVVKITTLTNRQFANVLDPVGADGKPSLGRRELRVGEVSFFLQPGERLESGIQNVYVLGEDEALLLRARESHGTKKAGDKWMVTGPCDFIPNVEIDVVERRKSIPLDDNEGIYVRDTTTGTVRAVVGETYMLKADEELWQKILPETIETLLSRAATRDRKDTSSGGSTRDPTRVVTYRVPHNAAVQVYDYKAKRSRVVLGPELVMLGPDEQFTLIDLSGDIPKRPNQIQSLAMFLGPDFMTDQVVVETSDHARLALKLSYNWHFEFDGKDPEKIFSTPDFVGDLCKAAGSLVRGAVAAASFDEFHKGSTDIIQSAVFGKNPDGSINDKLKFSANNLVVTNIDVQSVEPIDQRTRDSLQKSVQLAIEITTKSQESTARHEAERDAQEAQGALERQRITDESEAEKSRLDLLALQAQSAAVESTGQATAEAKARAEAAKIEGEAEVVQARLRARAAKLEFDGDLEQLKAKQSREIEYASNLAELEVKRAREIADIEADKFKQIVNAIGADTIASIAQAGPEMQAKLLQGLGLKSFMITDGNSPINLFNTAGGLVGGQ